MLYLVSGTNSLYRFVNLILVQVSHFLISSSFSHHFFFLIYSRHKTYPFHKSYPRIFTRSFCTAFTDFSPDRFFWATRFLVRPASRCRRAYILSLWFFFLSSFFQRLISEVTERISAKLGHIFTYDCKLKNLVRSPPGVYPGLGAKFRFFGTDFELWPKISLQRNVISTIGKKLVNPQGLLHMPPKFGKLWSTTADRLASFCQPLLKFTHRTSCRLTFWFNYIRQMAPMVDADANSLVRVGEAARRAGSRWALPCI